MFARQNTSAHAPSIVLLKEGGTSPARPNETTPCLTTVMTVADPGALVGAGTWGVSNGAWIDDEIWLKDRAACPRTSGYLSAEYMKNPHRCTNRVKASEQTLSQHLVQQYSLKLPDDFTAPTAVYGEGQAKAIGRDPVISVTQNQLTEIVLCACHELTATPFSNSLLCSKQLSYGSPHIGLKSDPQPPASGQQKSAARGRSTTVKHSTESSPARTSIRWRSHSHDNDEFFDARESLSRSRSRTPASRGCRPTSPSPLKHSSHSSTSAVRTTL